jgi:hypothetical protein
MEVPPGVVFQGTKVCRLRKVLYGLKQSLWAWFEKFCYAIKNMGLIKEILIIHFSLRGIMVN